MAQSPFLVRLLEATNAHDVERIVGCFTPEYLNETPCHPARGFRGKDQVRRNWTAILAAVPDLDASVVDEAVRGEQVWSEWEMRGTRRGGPRHLMRGVMVFWVEGDRARSCRFYMEPVVTDETTADGFVASLAADGRVVILVVGGTGRLGSQVSEGLLSHGYEVRVLTRGVRSPTEQVARAEMVAGSVTDPAVLDRAMAGVDLVVSAFTGFPFTNPSRVDSAGNTLLVQAAERVGAEVVLVSVAGAAPDSEMGLFRAKFEAEQALEWSRVRGTIIRPDAFADLWIELLTTSARRSHRPLVFGRGNASIGWVAVLDVASLVVRVVDQPSLRGIAYTLTGPEQISLTDLARRLMSVRGWPGSPRHLPVPALRASALLPGRIGRQAQAALAMDNLAPAGDDSRTRIQGLPNTPVAELFGTKVV